MLVFFLAPTEPRSDPQKHQTTPHGEIDGELDGSPWSLATEGLSQEDLGTDAVFDSIIEVLWPTKGVFFACPHISTSLPRSLLLQVVGAFWRSRFKSCEHVE